MSVSDVDGTASIKVVASKPLPPGEYAPGFAPRNAMTLATVVYDGSMEGR